MARPVFIPHPLCGTDDKTLEHFYAVSKSDRETLAEYVRRSGNPRWAASHILRAVSRGLEKADPDRADQVWELANQLCGRDQ